MLKNKPKVIEIVADDSSHSHFALVGDNGETLWEESGSPIKTKRDQFCIREKVYHHEDPNQSGIAGENIDHALPTNEEQYRKIFQNSIVGMFQTTPDGRFINLNIALAKIFGYDSPKELMSNIQNIQRQIYVNPKDRDLAHELVEKNGFLKNYKVQCSHVSGSIIWIAVNIRKVTDDQGRTLYNEGSVQDITERKWAEDALRQSEEKFKKLFNNAQVGMFRTRIDGSAFLDLNDKYLSILGVTREEIVGNPSVVYWADSKEREKMVKILKAKGHVENKECILITKDNRSITCLTSCRLYPDQGLLEGSIVDITAYKRMEEELQKAQKLDSIGVLAGGIAHDFNNLLGGIFGYIDLAIEESDKSKLTFYLSKSMSTIDRARALTAQLLTFACGGVPITRIGPLFPFVKEAAQFALSGANISCHFDIPQDLRYCNFDKNQISQVIDNLIINAQQAMPIGGTIELVARNITFAKKEHLFLEKGNYVKMSVKDNGIGIPKEQISRIFDPFFTTKTKGRGLGLATCHSIVNKHGGYIDVESELGKGSIFHVYLPACAAAESSTVQELPPRHKGSGTFLIMDDENVIREAVHGIIASFGYKVVCTENGKEAVDVFAAEVKSNQRIVGMILDLTVPGAMGGKAAVEKIRKMNAGAEIPIFVASGYSEDSVMRNPSQYGFTASICKPFTIIELAEMLNKFMK